MAKLICLHCADVEKDLLEQIKSLLDDPVRGPHFEIAVSELLQTHKSSSQVFSVFIMFTV